MNDVAQNKRNEYNFFKNISDQLSKMRVYRKKNQCKSHYQKFKDDYQNVKKIILNDTTMTNLAKRKNSFPSNICLNKKIKAYSICETNQNVMDELFPENLGNPQNFEGII